MEVRQRDAVVKYYLKLLKEKDLEIDSAVGNPLYEIYSYVKALS